MSVCVIRVRMVQVETKKFMIRKLKSGKYRLYSRKVDAKTGKRKNLGTFDTRAAAEKHERAVQFFKRGMIYFLPAAAIVLVGSAPSQRTSAVGPYIDGTDLLSMRKYTPSWAR